MSGRFWADDESTLAWALGAAFVLLIACFLGSTAYALHVSSGILAASEQITADASPGVLRLASARTELRHLEATVHRLLGREYFNPFDGQELDRSMDRLDAEIQAFQELPLDPQEKGYVADIERQRRTLRRAIDEIVDLASSDRPAARNIAEVRIAPLIDALDQSMTSVADVDNQEARRLAQQIVRMRETGRRMELTLDALSAVFGIVLLYLVVQSLKRFTGLLREQQRTLEARANELDDFSGRVAHDIRGPLASLDMALQLLSNRAGDEGSQELVGKAQRSLKRAADIVDGLYEFARSGAKPDPGAHCDAKAVLADVVEELEEEAEAARIALSLDVRSDGWVACSVGVLASIASNLTRNALKYMGQSAERRVTVRLQEADAMMRIEVDDTGPGLPPDFQRVIFEPHARAPGTDQPGLGLGLATVKRLAQAHGGTVSVESTPGKGSCFRVELPKTRK